MTFLGQEKPSLDEALEHFGVKGMKWGQRKDDSGGSGQRGPVRRGLTKANTALDAGSHVIKEGEKGLIFLPKEHRDQAASATQHRVLGVATQVNKDPKYRGKDLKKDPELKKAYYNEVQKHAMTIYKDELEKARGRAFVDTINSIFSPGYSSLSYTSPRSRVRHADAPDTQIVLTLHFDKDELGQIVGIRTAEPASLQQSIDYAEEHLEHFGVKGMKWGVRRENRLESLRRVAEGRATRGQQVRVATTQLSTKSVQKSGGLRNAAKVKVAELERRKERIQKGKATVGDFLALHGGNIIHENSGSKAAREAKRSASASTKSPARQRQIEKSRKILKKGAVATTVAAGAAYAAGVGLVVHHFGQD